MPSHNIHIQTIDSNPNWYMKLHISSIINFNLNFVYKNKPMQMVLIYSNRATTVWLQGWQQVRCTPTQHVAGERRGDFTHHLTPSFAFVNSDSVRSWLRLIVWFLSSLDLGYEFFLAALFSLNPCFFALRSFRGCRTAHLGLIILLCVCVCPDRAPLIIWPCSIRM